jgi:hypothetical protein
MSTADDFMFELFRIVGRWLDSPRGRPARGIHDPAPHVDAH